MATILQVGRAHSPPLEPFKTEGKRKERKNASGLLTEKPVDSSDNYIRVVSRAVSLIKK